MRKEHTIMFDATDSPGVKAEKIASVQGFILRILLRFEGREDVPWSKAGHDDLKAATSALVHTSDLVLCRNTTCGVTIRWDTIRKGRCPHCFERVTEHS